MIRLLIAGDYIASHRVAALAREGRHDEVMHEVKVLNAQADYSVANFEGAVRTEAMKPISKMGFTVGCHKSGVEMLRHAGFDCVTLANNHFFDYGDHGVAHTLQALADNGIAHVGGGRDIGEASQTLYARVKDSALAIINCCEHEFCIATDSHGGANPIGPIEQYHAIQEARSKADHVVVIVHGGIEQYPHPTPRMQQTYRFFIDAGADAVVNHHQHRICGTETYKGKPILYGLGNFCYDAPRCIYKHWTQGCIAILHFDGGQVGFTLHPFTQCAETPTIHFLEGSERSQFDKEISRLNAVIADSDALREHHERFMDSTPNCTTLLTPYTKRWTKRLYQNHLLPSFFPRSKWMELLNQVECESHRERLIHYIKKNQL